MLIGLIATFFLGVVQVLSTNKVGALVEVVLVVLASLATGLVGEEIGKRLEKSHWEKVQETRARSALRNLKTLANNMATLKNSIKLHYNMSTNESDENQANAIESNLLAEERFGYIVYSGLIMREIFSAIEDWNDVLPEEADPDEDIVGKGEGREAVTQWLLALEKARTLGEDVSEEAKKEAIGEVAESSSRVRKFVTTSGYEPVTVIEYPGLEPGTADVTRVMRYPGWSTEGGPIQYDRVDRVARLFPDGPGAADLNDMDINEVFDFESEEEEDEIDDF
jgi:hypothetical protein